MHEAAIPFLREVVVFLVIAAILVPLFQRVRVSPVLGFLLAGVIIDPFGLGAFADRFTILGDVAITDVESVGILAEFGVVFLLFQDLSVVPILILVSAFSGAAGGSLLEALAVGFGVAIAAAIAIFILGRIVLHPLFRLAASARAPEFFVAITLLAVIGASAATAAAGLSLALGTFLAGLLLGQAGEFGLLVVGLAMAGGLIAGADGQFFLIVAGLAMMVTPALAVAGARVGAWLERGNTQSLEPDLDEIAELGHHVVIAGYGRVGAAIAALLREDRIDYVSLDLDTELVRKPRTAGEPVFYGDGRRAEVLASVGAERAGTIVLKLDVGRDAEQAVRDIRRRWPDVQVYARARDLEHAAELDAAGTTRTIPELAESSLQMGAFVLTGLGLPQDAVNTLVDRLREGGYEGI
jgi:hypothetical protein